MNRTTRYTRYQLNIENIKEEFFLICCDEEMAKTTLHEKLDKIDGLFEVEYNGHYGSNIMYSIFSEYDNDFAHVQVERAINDTVIEIREFIDNIKSNDFSELDLTHTSSRVLDKHKGFDEFIYQHGRVEKV